MDYKEQIDQAKRAAEKWRSSNPIVGVGDLRVDLMVDDLTRSITDLLARAEAAEARAEKAENCINKIETYLSIGINGMAWDSIKEYRRGKEE